MRPLISIIVPIYKVEKYLNRCLDSIINQTYKDLEIILVDDGSPDNCGRICDEYELKDNRIKVIHKENGGLSDARNVAIDIAKGEYITFIDSDDYVTIDYVESLYNIINKYNAEMSISLPNSFKEGTIPAEYIESKKEKIFDPRMAVSTMFYQELFDNYAWAKLYHKSLFDNIRYPKGLLFEDLPTTYKLMFKCKTIVFINYKNYYYLQRNDSIEGGAFNKEKYESALTVIEMMEKDPDIHLIHKSYLCRKISFLFHILLQVPNGNPIAKFLFEEIKKYRFSVITNPKARKKSRLACILSYFGLNTMSYFYKLTQ